MTTVHHEKLSQNHFKCLKQRRKNNSLSYSYFFNNKVDGEKIKNKVIKGQFEVSILAPNGNYDILHSALNGDGRLNKTNLV